MASMDVHRTDACGPISVDLGYDKVCAACGKRYGNKVFGVRYIDIVPCPGHETAFKDKEKRSKARALRAGRAYREKKRAAENRTNKGKTRVNKSGKNGGDTDDIVSCF